MKNDVLDIHSLNKSVNILKLVGKRGGVEMYKVTRKPLTPEQRRVLDIMLWKAHRIIGQSYTTADLREGIENTSNTHH